MHKPRTASAVVFLLVVLSSHAHSATMSMERHMEIQQALLYEPQLAELPSIKIDSVLATVPVDDRLNADAAFSGSFVDAVRNGMTWYLGQRGVRVVQTNEDIRIVGTITNYEGNKGWGDWGVEIAFEVKAFRGKQRLITEQLDSRFSYSDDHDVVNQVKALYAADGHKVSFIEVLFTRVGVDLSEKLIVFLKEQQAVLQGTEAAKGAPLLSSHQERGMISIDASDPHAEVFVDGGLVGTTPLIELSIPAGKHVLEVRKSGFTPWNREIVILDGAKSSFFADLKSEDS